MFKLYINSKIDGKYGYRRISQETIQPVLDIMDSYIINKTYLENEEPKEYMVIENKDDCDFPIYLGYGDVDHYLKFREKYEPQKRIRYEKTIKGM